ncbi:Uncharacterised protein [Candidatus Bartonella washoeensis]|nr:Uncharacterised protein [Bartonella washoeensis]
MVSLRARPAMQKDGKITRVIGTIVNITNHKKAEERLLHDAIYDSLTGLPNQQIFSIDYKLQLRLIDGNCQSQS